MHGAFFSAILSIGVHIIVSLSTQPDQEKASSPGLVLRSSVQKN